MALNPYALGLFIVIGALFGGAVYALYEQGSRAVEQGRSVSCFTFFATVGLALMLIVAGALTLTQALGWRK